MSDTQELLAVLENGDSVIAVIKQHERGFSLEEKRVINDVPVLFSTPYGPYNVAGSCFDVFLSVALAFATERDSKLSYLDNPKGTLYVGLDEQRGRRRGPLTIKVNGG